MKVLKPEKIIEEISNLKTGEKYKNDEEWKAKGIPESDIRRDVTILMPSLDLFGKTKQNDTMAITRSKQARQMYKKGSEPVVQGGVENYLGRQPEVQAPRKWQSGPDKPATELAYITEAEKDLLLKAARHGS